MQPVVRMSNVTKAFGPNLAVNGVTFEVMPGRVHALMGENGAGKSTLMKILAGVHKPDAGEMVLNGRRVAFASPRQAMEAGVSTVFQELSLLPNLTIAENMFLGKEIIGPFAVPDRRKMEKLSRDALQELGMDIAPDTLVSELTIAQRQFVEIAHGVKADAQVFILDEPTAALNAADVEILNRQIRALKASGKAIIYISHRMDEIFGICDEVTVMKDGRHVATRPIDQLTPDSLIALMVGRELSDLFPQRAAETGPVRLACRDLRLTPESAPIDFELRAGEIVGLAGLEGQGQQDIVRSFIGRFTPVGGTLAISDRRFSLPLSSTKGLRLMQRIGVGFVPEDRKEEGLLLGLPILENIGISIQAGRPAYRLIASLRDVVAMTMKDLSVKAQSAAVAVGSLSGGNQQKVLLGRYLAAKMDVLIIEEPTRGVDVGAKAEIYRLLRALANDGRAILILSRETIELIGLCDRLLVVHGRRIVCEMPGKDATEHNILEAALTS